MFNKIIDMRKIRKVIALHHQGKSVVFIWEYLLLSRNTVKKYISLCQLLNLSMEEVNQKSGTELDKLFSSSKPNNHSLRIKTAFDFFPYMERALKNRSHQAIRVDRVL